ncbi:VOC family protein [Pararhodonellum marinum]|uniref:VOC family protein n=1 Tax=Pararhodonellum marinum TaxID=2755358 RepID=UPI00188F54A3|nr:VOC family protein [Pararhodonellum marinum]
MENEYVIPANTRIGHVHLKVADLSRSIRFYCDLLGFEIINKIGEEAVFISAGGYHHHIGLNTWYSKNSPRADIHSVGLFHTAIVYPTKKDLAIIYNRLSIAQYPFTGFADHGVSLALYLDDPDGNGVELYWDKPKEDWPQKEDGSILMYTKRLDIQDLLKEL